MIDYCFYMRIIYKKRDKRDIITFLELLLPYRKYALWALFLMFLTSLLQLPMPFLTRYLIDKVIPQRNLQLINKIGVLLIIFIFLRTSLSFIQHYFLIAFRIKVIQDIRIKIFKHLLFLPVSFFSNNSTGYIVSRASDDVEELQGLLADTFVIAVQNVLTFLVGIFACFYLHKKLTLFTLLILPVYCLAVIKFNKAMREKTQEVREKHGELNATLVEQILGIWIIKAFNLFAWANRRYWEDVNELFKARKWLSILSIVASSISSLISAFAPILLIWYGGLQIVHGKFTVGGLLAFNSFLYYVFAPIQSLVNINYSVQRAWVSVKRILKLLSKEKEINGEEKIEKIEFIRFENINFSYNDTSYVLKDINFEIRKGDKIAIVGKTGSGKSTLLKLIMGFYYPTSGNIYVNGKELKKVDIYQLRYKIGYVSQDVFLFKGSVRENLFIENNKVSDREIREVLEMTKCDFIFDLPEGLDSEIEELGSSLSGGEKQRIAIARALLRKPELIIFDEATSHLDFETEKVIKNALYNFFRDRIIIFVTHRLRIIKDFPKIVMMDKGTIIATGSHGELFMDCPEYRSLYLSHSCVSSV